MKISIITPNYNYAAFIGKTIESIISQNYPNIEHIIVDDGSTDNSVEVINAYVNKYPSKIKLIQQTNMGQSAALNRALENASGEIICWLNSDDKFIEGAFKKIISIFQKHKNIDAVFGNITIIDENDNEVRKVKYLPFNYTSGIFIGFGKIIPSNAIFWKRELTFNPKGIKKFNADLHYAMDSEYWSRLLLKKNVLHINEQLAYFRHHSLAKTIQRQSKNSLADIASTKEDQLVRTNALKYANLSNTLMNNLRFAYYKIYRHSFKLLHGHYTSS